MESGDMRRKTKNKLKKEKMIPFLQVRIPTLKKVSEKKNTS